jgi:uncharacterized protein (DUF608 family)
MRTHAHMASHTHARCRAALAATARHFASLYERARSAYEARLWNGSYFKYDCGGAAHSDSIMADQVRTLEVAFKCEHVLQLH